MKNQNIDSIQEYKYGFSTDIENIKAPKGLTKKSSILPHGLYQGAKAQRLCFIIWPPGLDMHHVVKHH